MSLGFGGTKRYRVVRPLGVGGMGEVYEVEDRGSGARVALKRMLTADPRRLLRFKQEFRLMAELHHPNLVRLFDLATEEGDWFFTMELVKGQDLLHLLTRSSDDERPAARGTSATEAALAATSDELPAPAAGAPTGPRPRVRRLPPACDAEPLLAVLTQLLDALEFLHRQGVVHRDLKPSNVLVDLDGRVRVLDFGLVSKVDRDEGISLDGAVVGTLAYMAPEQFTGEAATPASDLYALGCVLFQLLTGVLPFADGLAGALVGRMGTPPRVDQHVEGVAPALVDVVHRMMAVDPAARPGLDEIRATLGLAPGPAAARTDRFAVVSPSSEHFVGRVQELAALVASLETARDGRPQVALVSGPSGIGKTALADEVVRRATALGFVCFRGRSYEREQVPFVAFDRVMDAVTLALQRWSRDRLAPLQPAVRALARIFPALELLTQRRADEPDSADTTDPRELQRRAYDGLVRLLARWQADAPILLVLDDLQWADDESLDLLSAVLSGGVGRLAVLALARGDGARGAHSLEPLIRRLGAAAAGPVVAIALAPMPVDEAIEIVDSVGHGCLDHGTARALADHAGGNPFLVRRLAEHLAKLASGDRAAVLDASGSSDDVLREMIGALTPHAEQVLALAAAAGGDVPRSLLRDSSGLSGTEFDLAAGELMAARFLKTVPAGPAFSGRARGAADAPPVVSRSARGGPGQSPGDGEADARTLVRGRLDLYHDRIREVVYRGLGDERRRALHRGLALTLQSAPSDDGHDAEALARHWGEAGDRAQRRKFALEAAELAAAKLAFRRAAELLRLVESDPDPDEPAAVSAARWARIGELHEYGGDVAGAAAGYCESVRRWQDLVDDGGGDEARRELLEMRGHAGHSLMANGELARSRAVFERGLASIGLPLDRSLPARAATLLALTVRDRLAGAGKADVGKADPWTSTKIRFFEQMAFAFQIVQPLPAAEAALRGSLLARRAADHAARVHALAFSAVTPVVTRRCSPAELAVLARRLDTAEQIARTHGVLAGVELVQVNRAMLWLPTDPARARKASEAALAGLARVGMSGSHHGNRARAQNMVILYLTGALAELEAATTRELATDNTAMMTMVIAELLHARVHLFRGEVERAARMVEQARARVPAEPPTSLRVILHQADAALRLAEGRFVEALAGIAEGERVARASGAWLVGLSRTDWLETALEAALGVARQGTLTPRDRKRALGWARWLWKRGLLDLACIGARGIALLELAAGRRAAAEKAIARALDRSAAGATAHHRWLCLEAARDLGRLNLELENEAAELASRHHFVLPPGWRRLELGEGTP